MPSINPRLALTLTPARHDLLKRLAALQGVSMAHLVSELLEEFYPVLERVCVVLEAAKTAQETSKIGLRDAVAKAEEDLIPLLQATMGQFDLFIQQVEGATADMGARGAKAAGAPSTTGRAGGNPRVVTRGSGFQPPPIPAADHVSRKGSSKGGNPR